jgi:hypothetical protein
VTPFTLNTAKQFLPDPPEFFDLAGEEFTRDYNEVKNIGEIGSTSRTADQSQIAQFWYEGSAAGWNRIARNVSTQKGLDLWENARLFALLNFAMADGYIAGFRNRLCELQRDEWYAVPRTHAILHEFPPKMTVSWATPKGQNAVIRWGSWRLGSTKTGLVVCAGPGIRTTILLLRFIISAPLGRWEL